MQSTSFLNLQAAAMALNSCDQLDIGFFSDSAVSSPESLPPPPPYSATASPAHSLTESIDSAFHEIDDCFDASFYNDRQSSSVSQETLKSDLQIPNNNLFVDSRQTNFDWMSMPLIDFKFTEDQPTQNTYTAETTSADIDFRNLEIVLKEKAREKMLEQQHKQCSQDELKLLQNIMLYKQQQQQQQHNLMFTEPLNLPSKSQQTNKDTSTTVPVIDDPLPDDFLANNCANLIDFINSGNPNAKFPDNISSISPPVSQYSSSFNFQTVKNEYRNTCQQQPHPQQRPPPKVTILKPKSTIPHIPKHTSKPRLFNFLVELLQNPDLYGNCIEWKDKETGVFKFMDSAEVARLWGHRKNKPHMKYENFARSLRTYIAKGILTKPRNKLVYKFVKTVI